MSNPAFDNVIHVLQQEIEKAQQDNLALRGQIEDGVDQQRELSSDNEYLRKKVAALQQENTSYGNTQARLETQLYAVEQDMATLRKEMQQLTKSKKDAEKKLASELQDFENDRMRWQQREADLYNQIRSLNANLSAGEPRTPRTPRRRSITALNGTTTMSPFTAGGLTDIGEQQENGTSVATEHKPAPKLAAIDASYAREAKIAQRTIKAQDKLIVDLKSEIEKQKSALQEQQSEAQQQSLRIVHLEHEIANVKQVNRSLMEDNESYQILLHEKTISGEFMMNPIMQVDEEETKQQRRRSLKASTSTSSSSGGLNLAAELNLASVGTPDWDSSQASDTEKTVHKLTEEVKVLQDTNRALQLYMNKILMKIINNKQLEDVLSIDQPKPPSMLKQQAEKKEQEQKQQSVKISAAPGPAPSRTLSSTLLGKSSGTKQQRRRTISYWNNGQNNSNSSSQNDKTPPPPPPQDKADDKNARRHSTMLPEPSTPTTANSGWAKALRRMSGIGWSTNKSPTAEDELPPLPSNGLAAPSMSRSTSTNTNSSLRRSNELATLQEE